MTFFLAGQCRRAKADDCFAADERGAVGRFARRIECRLDLMRVVAVDVAHHLPAVRLEAGRGVVAEPTLDFTIDRNIVVVVQHHQFAQAKRACKRARFVADAFHQAAVAREYVGVVIDQRQALAVVAAGKHGFGNRHAHGHANTLAEGAGGGFHTRGDAVLGMSRRLAVHLPKVLQFRHR